jgi:hypothetical protein
MKVLAKMPNSDSGCACLGFMDETEQIELQNVTQT